MPLHSNHKQLLRGFPENRCCKNFKKKMQRDLKYRQNSCKVSENEFIFSAVVKSLPSNLLNNVTHLSQIFYKGSA